MKYIRFILIAVAAAFLVYFFFFVPNRDIRENEEGFETKTDERGQVTVKVTPQALSDTQWKFYIVFDTHSVDIDHDITQIAELFDSGGNTYKPITWEGSAPGGHHREGMLIFEAISPVPPFVELTIKDIGGVPARSFIWYTQQ